MANDDNTIMYIGIAVAAFLFLRSRAPGGAQPAPASTSGNRVTTTIVDRRQMPAAPVQGVPPAAADLILSRSGTTITARWTPPAGGWNTFRLGANPGSNNYASPSVVNQDLVGTSTTFTATPGPWTVWLSALNSGTGDAGPGIVNISN